ncbi:MAG: hypothetical protein N2047_03950 [Meiothermus sp.]|jgi:hypothetical protein|nr:hypothetical protein [Meiothermus sp.]GIW31438.1 MAG: hypothetical protein KatS3mg071_1612 [Meiothermus sp.]
MPTIKIYKNNLLLRTIHQAEVFPDGIRTPQGWLANKTLCDALKVDAVLVSKGHYPAARLKPGANPGGLVIEVN